MKFVGMLFLLLCAGCKETHLMPNVTYGVHKVWRSHDSMSYQGTDGYGLGCANIDRSENGFVYNAYVICWKDLDCLTPRADFNTLEDAEVFVERWCKEGPAPKEAQP